MLSTLHNTQNCSPRVLVVDDDKVVLQVLSKILQKAGHLVDTVETAKEALSRLETSSYDSIIIDVHLQDMNGLDLLSKVGTIAPSMRKIVLTGYPSDEDRKRALEQTADFYLIKPVTPGELIESIECKTNK